MSIAPTVHAESRPIRTLVNLERLLARLLVGTGLLLAVSAMIFMAGLSLDELTARQKLLNLVNEKIQKEQGDLAALPATAMGTDAVVGAMRGRLALYDSVRTATQLLIASGGSARSDEVIALRSALQSRGKSERLGTRIWMIREVRLLSNSTLLIILLAVCGAIGTALASARRKTHFTMYSVGMGMAAGFITYLAITGGKEVLLVGASSDDIIVNPNSSAFFALMAGMFTERAYGMLTSMVDSFTGARSGREGRPPRGGKEG